MRFWAAAFHLSVIIPGVVLLQYHAIIFWTNAVGFYTGIGWSILLEIVSFWCWFQRGIKTLELYFVRTLGFLTVLLLLIGPLFTVSETFIEEFEKGLFAVSDYTYKRKLLIDSIVRKKNQSNRLLKIIEETKDGYITFNRINRDINRMEYNLVRMKPPERGKRLPWQAMLVMLMQATFIFIVQSVIILGILRISKIYYGIDGHTQSFVISSYRDLISKRQTESFPKEEE